MMMIWITMLVIIGIQVLPIGKTAQKNYLEQVLSRWSYKLMRSSAIDQNWLTSSNDAECTEMMDFVSGNCVAINHLEGDSRAQKQLFESFSAFYVLCYTLVRRTLEIFSLYMARWLPLGCVGIFFVSGSLVAISHLDKNSRKWKKKGNVSLSRSWITTFVGFSLSSLSILSVILPVVADYILGGIIDRELESFQEETREYAIERVLRGEKSKVCLTMQGFYDFRCLRKTLFDLNSSRVQELSVEGFSLYEKICLQIQIALINGITVLATCILYGIPVLLLYVTVRLYKKKLERKMDKSNSFVKPSRNLKPLVKEEDVSEKCNKKTVEPGMRNPWQELSFSTNIEDHLEKFIKEDSAIRRKKSERAPAVVHSLKWLKYTPYDSLAKGPIKRSVEKPFQKRLRTGETTPRKDVSRPTSTRNDRMTKSPSIHGERKMKGEGRTTEEGIIYTDAGTNVCFDTDGDSDSSDFSSDQ